MLKTIFLLRRRWRRKRVKMQRTATTLVPVPSMNSNHHPRWEDPQNPMGRVIPLFEKNKMFFL